MISQDKTIAATIVYVRTCPNLHNFPTYVSSELMTGNLDSRRRWYFFSIFRTELMQIYYARLITEID
jgi:hypothetical protein